MRTSTSTSTRTHIQHSNNSTHTSAGAPRSTSYLLVLLLLLFLLVRLESNLLQADTNLCPDGVALQFNSGLYKIDIDIYRDHKVNTRERNKKRISSQVSSLPAPPPFLGEPLLSTSLRHTHRNFPSRHVISCERKFFCSLAKIPKIYKYIEITTA